MSSSLLNERKDQVWIKSQSEGSITCEKKSLAGSVSQRACVFCGSRVVLYPVADALHIVHGPIGCASFTWDIRGSLSSGPELHRLSFSTDLKEKDVVFGGEKKLERALVKLIEEFKPKAAFVFATCITGIIGDDIGAVCKKVGLKVDIPVIPVHSEGFKGTKKDGYKAACDALAQIVGTGDKSNVPKLSINILGEFNLAGEAWMIQKYYERMGIEVVSVLTGDGRVEKISRSHGASLNVVQCSGSLSYLAKHMEKEYDIPFMRVSYFGIEDMSKALYDVADFFSDYPEVREKAEAVVAEELSLIIPAVEKYRKILTGKKTAVYVGGAFKAFSLIKALKLIGMTVVVAGSQTGNREDYEQLKMLCDPGCIIVDDSNPLELSDFVIEKHADLFIGGVKERPIAFKLGIGFCDHNHERKIALAGYTGMINFFKEVHDSVMSPVWNFVSKRSGSLKEII